MANDNHLSSVTCYYVAMQKHNYYNKFFELGKQKINFDDFINKKLTGEILDDLNYQLLRRLKKEGFLTLETLFIDGTKMDRESAKRATFMQV